MKLTDEERWMMNEVAINYAKQSDDFDDAWRRAAEFLDARRRVIGQPEQDDIGEPIDNDLRLAAEALYSHRWTCDSLPGDEQAAMWSALRDALGLPPGTATAAGVGNDVKADDQLQPGDYVLATKFDDGDPGDHFVVGYLANPPKLARNSDRWMVVNGEGIPFRANGFRRAEKITPDEGQTILAIMPQIANVEGPSLWEHLARIRDAAKGCEAGGAATSAEAVNDECSVLRQLLSVYIHAHDNAKWVPPHIVVEAKKAAWRRAKGGE